MRSAPRAPAPVSVSRASEGIVRTERAYRFLTPVFGGGVRVDAEQSWKKDADPRTPVRVPSIRGQLRFWWRACNPRRCTTSRAPRESDRFTPGPQWDQFYEDPT